MKLDPTTLQSMYPAPTEDFSRRMAQLPHALKAKEAAPVKRFLPRTAIIVVLAVLALSTTAYALTQPAVLDWLLGAMGSGSAQLQNIAQTVQAEATADGVTVRITGAVFDGSELAFSYEIENGEPSSPVLVALEPSFRLNGQEVGLPSYRVLAIDTRLVPSPHLDVLPARRNPLPGGVWSNIIPLPLAGKVTAEATFIVYRPTLGYAVLIDEESMLRDEILLQTDPEIADSMNTLRSFTNAVIADIDQLDADLWAAQGYTAIDESGSMIFLADDPRSNTTEAARITVPFTFDSDKAIAYDFSGTEVDLADFTVHAATFRLTPLRTDVDVRLIPRENTEAAARTLAERCGAYALTDDRGQPVVYSDMDYCSSLLPYVTCMEGQWVCRYLIDMPGLLTFPQSVGFAVQTGELLRLPLE